MDRGTNPIATAPGRQEAVTSLSNRPAGVGWEANPMTTSRGVADLSLPPFGRQDTESDSLTL